MMPAMAASGMRDSHGALTAASPTSSSAENTDASGVRERREASGLVAAYLQWHLERSVPSLKHVERV